MLRFRNWDLIWVASLVLLAEQVEAVLVRALVTRLHHHRLHMVRITHKSHLLGVHWLLLIYLAGLYSNPLRLHMNCATIALARHRVLLGLPGTALRRLLLREAHVLGLHHVGGHGKRLLMMRCPTNRANLRLLYAHHIQRLLWRHCMMNIVVYGLLPTKVGVIIVKRI